MKTVATIFTLYAATSALQLPSYLVPCSRRDPDLNACAKAHGKTAIPRLVQGDKRYRIPTFQPLIIPRVRVEGGSHHVGSTLTFDEMRIHGLEKTELKDVRIDLEKKHIDWAMSVPRIEILCQYAVKGRVLILPIVGSGPGNITMVNSSLVYSYDYKVDTRKNGKTFMRITDSILRFDTQRAHIRLDNLFNGDKFLGRSMNKFLDENWRDIVKDVGPYIADGIGQAIKQIISNIANVVEYDNIFLP